MKQNFALCVILLTIASSCGSKKTETTSTEDTTAVATQPVAPVELNLSGDVVCVWEGVPVYDQPSKKAKWLAGISLGETVKYLDETTKDAEDKDKEYIKVELYDGKTGWAPTYGLIRDAKLGAVVNELSIVYKRPQLAAISDKKLKMMDIIAVSKTEGDFVEVAGVKKTITGWVKKGDITTNENDVTVALLALKMIPADATGDVLKTKMKEFLSAAPSGSTFYQVMSDRYNEMVMADSGEGEGEGEADTTSTGN